MSESLLFHKTYTHPTSDEWVVFVHGAGAAHLYGLSRYELIVSISTYCSLICVGMVNRISLKRYHGQQVHIQNGNNGYRSCAGSP